MLENFLPIFIIEEAVRRGKSLMEPRGSVFNEHFLALSNCGLYFNQEECLKELKDTSLVNEADTNHGFKKCLENKEASG